MGAFVCSFVRASMRTYVSSCVRVCLCVCVWERE